MSSIDVTVDLIKAVLANMDPPKTDDWVAMTAILDPADSKMFAVTRTSGYVYAADGTPTATGIDAIPLTPAMRAYMESYYAPGEPWPARLLVQFNRVSGEYDITFEESDTTRWQLGADSGALHDEIRPQL